MKWVDEGLWVFLAGTCPHHLAEAHGTVSHAYGLLRYRGSTVYIVVSYFTLFW